MLQKERIEHFEPKLIGKEADVEIPLRKLGRNEPCYCDSGVKYKKCYMNKDIKETGKVKKVEATYYPEEYPKMKKEGTEVEYGNEENGLWEDGYFAETLGQDIKERMKTIHKKT